MILEYVHNDLEKDIHDVYKATRVLRVHVFGDRCAFLSFIGLQEACTCSLELVLR